MVDKDGIPHFTGAVPGLMKEYRRRVLFAYGSLEGSGDDEDKIKKSLTKKKSRFALRLVHALHGLAWKECEDLVLHPEKLKEEDGYKHVLAALQGIEKVGVIRKTEAFEAYFDHCHRRKGQTIDSFLRQRRQAWADLEDLAENVKMSDDLQAFNLSKDDRRQILLANQSAYTVEGIERALRVSYYDIHERERQGGAAWPTKKPKGFGKKSFAHATTAAGEDVMPPAQSSYEGHTDYPDLPKNLF